MIKKHLKLSMATFIIAISTSVLFISSCKDENPNSVKNELMQAIVPEDSPCNPDDIACYFRITTGIDWAMLDINDLDNVNISPVVHNLHYAYISDGSQFITPASMKCNGQNMSLMDATCPGQYWHGASGRDVVHDNTVSWEINNYMDTNYNVENATIPLLILTNMSSRNAVVSKSQSLNITYSGVDSAPNTKLTVTILGLIYNEDGYNEYSIEKKDLPDNGSISISAAELANMPLGGKYILFHISQ